MSIGSRIKEARENRGLSRAELANIIGISASSISNYENEISSPKDSILYALIETLQVDANFIFQDEIKKSPTPAKPEEGDLKLEDFTDEDVDALRYFFRARGIVSFQSLTADQRKVLRAVMMMMDVVFPRATELPEVDTDNVIA